MLSRLSPRAGSPSFSLEKEMAPIVRCWLESQRLAVKPEFAAPWGTCDFVGLAFDRRRVTMRLRLGQRRPIGSLLRVSLLQEIPDAREGSISLRRLERVFSGVMSPSRFAIEIQALVAARFVRYSRCNAVERLNGWAPLHRRIVAVELKLGRVQDGLAQATSHLRFANESYVAFPATLARTISSSRRAKPFDEVGVGIIAVTRGCCTVVLRPRHRAVDADPVLQSHCVERFWRTRTRDSGA
jgi:hypothetical protein